jgi:hypothetical protein
VYLIVPTPSDANGFFLNDHLLSAISQIGKVWKTVEDLRTLVIVSTVMPGSTRTTLLPCLEEASGKKIGQNLQILYSPEFIAIGSVIHDLHYPDLLLIGGTHVDSIEKHISIMKSINLSESIVRVLNLEEAELVNILINNYITTKITFANHIANRDETRYFNSKSEAYEYARISGHKLTSIEKLDNDEITPPVTYNVILGVGDHRRMFKLTFASDEVAQKWEHDNKDVVKIQWNDERGQYSPPTTPRAPDTYGGKIPGDETGQLAEMDEGEQQKGADYRDPPEADYGADYQDMVARVKKLAGMGPLKTVYDPQKRVYRNVPTAVQPPKK